MLVRYEGEWQNEVYHGNGTTYYPTNVTQKCYEGEWKDGKRDGYGIEYYSNGNKYYEGTWHNSERHGQGIVYYTTGDKEYEGEYRNGKPHGQGVKYACDGTTKVYEGAWSNGNPHGQGVLYRDNTTKIYEGSFVEGQTYGKGVAYHCDGTIEYHNFCTIPDSACTKRKRVSSGVAGSGWEDIVDRVGSGDVTAVEAWLNAGGDVDAMIAIKDCLGIPVTGYTMLMHACGKGHMKLVELLLDRGANLHLKSKRARIA